MSDFTEQLRAAEAHLSAAEPPLARVIARVGPCTLQPDPQLFRVLVRAMIAQFISTAAARSMVSRLHGKLKGRWTAARLLTLTDDDLKACGVAGGKARAIRALAEHFRTDRGFARRVAAADPDTARNLLLPLRGVGPWTVDMVLMFGLGHLDVFPVGDHGLRAGAQELFRLEELPTPAELTTLAEPWRPYRSVGTWYVWRSRGWAGEWA